MWISVYHCSVLHNKLSICVSILARIVKLIVIENTIIHTKIGNKGNVLWEV